MGKRAGATGDWPALSFSCGLGGLSIGLFGLPHNVEVSRQLGFFMAAGGFRSCVPTSKGRSCDALYVSLSEVMVSFPLLSMGYQ